MPAAMGSFGSCLQASARKSRRVRCIVPSGRAALQDMVESAARDICVASKRVAPGDAVSGTSAPVARKRSAHRGGVPLQRFKRCHQFDDAAGGANTGSGPETSSRELDADRHLVSSARISRSPHLSSPYDGFMVEIMAMDDDECNLPKKMKMLNLQNENSKACNSIRLE
ncbi:uncharacterized protein [Dermacentor albipictus]|uniref:uncharacterized protein n=1 Tax=Dermacentor albipictus TaxID=60249 RepID=UPI0038FBE77D